MRGRYRDGCVCRPGADNYRLRVEEQSGDEEMKLSIEDQQLLDELCVQNGVSQVKVLKLLETVYNCKFKER